MFSALTWGELGPRLLWFLLFASCFLSFWHSSVVVFRRQKSKRSFQSWCLKILSILVWNGTYVCCYVGAFSKDIQLTVLCAFTLTVSFILYWWSVRSLRQNSQTLSVIFESTTGPTIIQEGLYRWVRHPFYLSYILAYLAVATWVTYWPLSFLALMLAFLYVFAAQKEEKEILQSPLAAEYLEYCKTAGRFGPTLFRRGYD